MSIVPVLSQMGLLFFVAALGFVAAKVGLMDEKANKQIAGIVLNITLPVSVLYSSFNTERTLSNSQVFVFLLISAATCLAATLFAKLVLPVCRVRPEQRSICSFEILFTNGAFIGYPFLRVMFGESAVFFGALLSMVCMIYSYTYGVYLIKGQTDRDAVRLKDVFSPVLVSSLVGLLLYLLKFSMPSYGLKLLAYVDQMTGPLSMLMIGSSMAFARFEKKKNSTGFYVAVLLRMLILPVLIKLAGKALGVNELAINIEAVLMAMPAPASTTMFCAKYDKDQALSSSGVVVSTLALVATLPIVYKIIMMI